LDNLAGLFRLKGSEFSSRALNLFNGLQQEQQLELFTPTTSRSMKEDQLTVGTGVYQSFGFRSEPNEQGDEVLVKIRDAMRGDEGAPEAERKLKEELTLWLDGRAQMLAEKFPEAKLKFGEAILENPKNPALYYDRARANIEMGKSDEYNYSLALTDLEDMLRLDPTRANLARLIIQKDDGLSRYWSQHGEESNYPILAQIIITTVALVDEKGISIILIPEGPFNMGSDSGVDDEQPVHQVNLSAYYIDQYEVTNAAYKLCVDAGACQPPLDTSSFTRAGYYGNSQFDNYPVIYVDWNMSKTYCEWRGARLPTESEWEKAARGMDGRTYPWGETIDCTYANYAGDPKGACVGDTTAVGSYASGQSPYGVYDMAGNVWEWVNDWYSETYYSSSPVSDPQGPGSGPFRVLRGGSWYSSNYGVRSAVRGRFDPTSSGNDVGFRCASSQ
jgi:formylglycine-generating enzyme required for sulfatase activity